MTSLIFLRLLEVADAVRGMYCETQDSYEVFQEIWDHSCPLLLEGM
jgi:hypothetical protein